MVLTELVLIFYSDILSFLYELMKDTNLTLNLYLNGKSFCEFKMRNFVTLINNYQQYSAFIIKLKEKQKIVE